MTNHEALCKTLTDQAKKIVVAAEKEAKRYQNFRKPDMLATIEIYRQKAFTLWTLACGLQVNGYDGDLAEVILITSDAESTIADIYNEMTTLR